MAVQTSQSLAEGLSAVRSISAKPSDAEMRQLDGHLVHLTSPLQTERVTDDQVFLKLIWWPIHILIFTQVPCNSIYML